MKNTKNQLEKYIKQIKDVNKQCEKAMEAQLDGLTKPVGALGSLEEMIIQLSGIYGGEVKTSPAITIIMCADNGVCEEGISSCPQEVTATVTTNFTRGITAMNKLSEFANSNMHIVNIGVKGVITHPKIKNRKLLDGTANMAKEPAMSYEKAIEAVWVGIEETEQLIEAGYEIFGTGEMGIGNTTTSAAVLAALLDVPVVQVTGKGAGAKAKVYQTKIATIEKAIECHKPNKGDPIDVLAKIGGLDLAGLVGVFIAAARHQKAVVIDGFISAVAALVAYRLAPEAKAYMITSHLSEEIGMQMVLQALGKKAYLNLGMRLGEGSGCPIMFTLLELAKYTLMGMGTFEEAGVDATDYQDLWKTDENN